MSDGRYSVQEILGRWGETVIFVATNETDPGSRHLYRASALAPNSAFCLTNKLPMFTNPEVICQYSDFYISAQTTFYVQVWIFLQSKSFARWQLISWLKNDSFRDLA